MKFNSANSQAFVIRLSGQSQYKLEQNRHIVFPGSEWLKESFRSNARSTARNRDKCATVEVNLVHYRAMLDHDDLSVCHFDAVFL